MAGQAEDKMSGNVEITTRMGATHHEMGKDQHISHLTSDVCFMFGQPHSSQLNSKRLPISRLMISSCRREICIVCLNKH